MIEFFKTRTRMQWLAATAWFVLVSVITIADYQSGKPGLAIMEFCGNAVIFAGAAWYAHKTT